MDNPVTREEFEDLQYIVYNHRHKGYDKTKVLGIQPDIIVNLQDGASVPLDASVGDVFFLVANGNRTILAPTNPVIGDKIIIWHFANGAARTLSLQTGAGGFRFGDDPTSLTSTDMNKMDYIGCMWNDIDGFWDIIAYSKNY